MKKKVIAAILCVALVMGSIPFAFSSAGAANYAAIGNYVYEMKADKATNSIPAAFGTKAANGKVWTDKSVQIDGDGFNITLSALSQEYIQTSSDMITESIGVDVAMAIDMTGSMGYEMGDSSGSRVYAMCKAVNDALEVIMAANPNNRAIVYTFSGSSGNGSAKLFLPLGHYTNKNWKQENVNWTSTSNTQVTGKYIDLSGSYSKWDEKYICTIVPNADMLVNGAKPTATEIKNNDGTCAQYGILATIKGLCDAIKGESHTIDRVPFFLFFTDGVCCLASKSWYQELPTRNTLSYNDNGSAGITALTILSSAIGKQRLADAYKAYNGNGKDVDVPWYNVGLIPESERVDYVKALMEPKAVLDETDTKSKIYSVKNSIATYTSESDSTYKAYAEWGKNGKYVYNSDYIFYANTQTDLDKAFASLSSDIAERSRVKIVPVVNKTASGSELVTDLIFTDVLGSGMKVNESTIALTPADSPLTPVKGVKKGSAYTFTGYKTTLTIAENSGQQTVTVSIPPSEIGLFSFKSASDLDNGQYVSSTPTQVNYHVDLASPTSDKAYSNAFAALPGASAEFFVIKDNPYYFDVTTDEKNVFVEGTLKEALASGKITAKETNTTETYANISNENYGNVLDDELACDIKNYLGNNGVMIPSLKITKTQDDADKIVHPGQDVTYTVKVENLTKNDIEKIVIDDIIPAGTTWKSSEDFTSDKTLEAEIAKLEAESSKELTFTVTVNSGIADETKIEGNDPKITSVNDVTITGGYNLNSNLDLTADTTTYTVTYSWGTYNPAAYTLPTDSNAYYNGDAFTANYTNIAKNTVVEIKDVYGNVTETHKFTGWNQDSGNINKANVVLTAQWENETKTLDTYSVTYSWTGLPAALELTNAKPTDATAYVNNQPYTIDTKYTSSTVVYTYDAYGNQTDKYTFSGWDKTDGNIDNANVAVSGTWAHNELTLTKYHIAYSFGVYTPSSVTLPTDTHDYVHNEPFTADTAALKTGDEFPITDGKGGLVGTQVFQGWDITGGTIDQSDVVITAQWNYVPAGSYSITYQWDGDAPADVTPPTDSTVYYAGNSYTVDNSITSPHINNEGKWTFNGWDTASGTISESLTIKGTWTKEAPKSVTYNWGDFTPSDINAPVDNNNYYNGDTFTADSAAIAKNTVIYDSDGNKWTFNGWTPASGTINGQNVTIVADWTKEEPKTITYDWGDFDPERTAPVDNTKYHNGDTFTANSAVIEKGESFEDAAGNKWTFNGWTPESGTINGQNVTIVADWTKEAPKTVTYDWGDFAPTGKNLPVDNTNYHNGDNYAADTEVVKKDDTFIDENGVKWTFNGWAPASGTINGQNITMIADWSQEAAKNITYNWGDFTPPGKNTPVDKTNYHDGDEFNADTEVIKKGDTFVDENGVKWTFNGWTPESGTINGESITMTPDWSQEDAKTITYDWGDFTPTGKNLPVDNTNYHNGDTYTTDTDAIKKGESFIDENGKKWTFDGWEPESGTIGDESIQIKPKWISEDAKSITYDWGDFAPTGKNLPVDNTNYHDGDEFTADTEVIKKGDTFVDENGVKWTFNSWTPESGTINGESITMTPDWSQEDAKSITYDWGDFAPAGKNLPVDNTKYHNGDTYTADTEVLKKGESFIDENGKKWTFDGWEPESGTIGDESIQIKPKWISEDAKTVTYDWGRFNPGKNVPVDSTNYHNGDTYTADTAVIAKGDTFIDGNKVKWTFNGWTPESGTVGDTNVTITADWTNEGAKSITYQFSGDVPESAVLPSDNKDYYEGDTYSLAAAPADIPTYDTFGNENGKYVFRGWEDPNEGVFGTRNLIINGVWEYVPEDVAKHDIGFTEKAGGDEGNVPAIKEVVNGDHIRIYPNGGEWIYDEITYSGDQMARILVIDDITVADPARKGYVFNGWEQSVENDELTLTAKWTEKKCNILPYIIGGAIIGGAITGAAAATATATGIAVGVSAAIGAIKALADKAEKNNTDGEPIPHTGSQSPALAIFALAASAAAAACIVLSKKKEEDR